MKTIPIFIGFDPRETVAYHVLCQSILARATMPVSITPIALGHLKEVFRREIHPLQSTQFSFSRFLVPWLSDYEGHAIFMDCDMMVLDDIKNLWNLRSQDFAVQVIKHGHIPREEIKFLGAVQTKYEKKNWSSVMLFNNQKCKSLTPDYVNSASGLQLHQFHWLEGDHLIGELPHRWNHLVGYDEKNPDVSNVHFTLGGPYFEEYKDCEYSREWNLELQSLLKAEQRQKK
ncbi:MAG: glycosyltransferase [Candidatus Cloacimonetes bacterium]|nr:glycosyltransferase [Candidatus Cloacimonadota bacterium]